METNETSPADVLLVGKTVTVSYVADPFFSRGEFRLENHSPVTVKAAVESAWLDVGEERQSLSVTTVFDHAKGEALDLKGFEVEATSTLSFALGFPIVYFDPPLGVSVSVGLRLILNGLELEAQSPIRFIRRIPRGH